MYSDAELQEILASARMAQPEEEQQDLTELNQALDEALSQQPEEPSVEQPQDVAEEILQNVVQSSEPVVDPFLVKDTTTRFKGAPWYDIAQQQTILLAGVGGIGSWTALLLSRMRPKAIFLYDSDNVESVNMSGQLYGVRHIGNSKVYSTIENASTFSDYHDIFAFNENFTETSEATDIMICGFDSMAARKTFYNSWKQHISTKSIHDRNQCLFIDGRMSAESIIIFCMTGNDTYYMSQYEQEWLFSDDEADAAVCSYKQTSYCAAMIGGLINNLFVNFCTNLGSPTISRTLPFITSYDADRMYLKLTE